MFPVLNSAGPALEKVPWQFVLERAAAYGKAEHVAVETPKLLELSGREVK